MRLKGFTLVELIVVIAIIAILAAIIAPNAFKAIEKSKIARIQQDMKSMQTAAAAYYSDVGLWPPDVCPNEDPGFVRANAYQNRCCGAVVAGADYETNWDGPYLEKFPYPTPWGGSYDWEWWPAGGWSQPPGTYVSARPKYNSVQQGAVCGYASPAIGSCPANYEIKLQQQYLDLYIPSGINNSDGTIIMKITQF